MDGGAAMDLPDNPPSAPESAAAAAATPPGTPGHVPGGGNDGANGALSAADLAAVSAAQKKTERKARRAAKNAREEKEKRTKALQHQRQVLRASGSVYDVAGDSTPPERKPFLDAEKPALRVGAYVEVEAALGIHGPARYGGKGYVVAVAGYGGATSVTVKYTLSAQRREAGIEIGRVTELESPLSATPVRKRKGRDYLDPSPATTMRSSSSSTLETTSTNIGNILDEGYRRHRKAGWRRHDLAVNGVTSSRLTADEQRLLLEDYRELMAAIRAEENLGVISRLHDKRRSGGSSRGVWCGAKGMPTVSTRR